MRALALALLVGCASGSASVEVTVDATGSISGIASLAVSVESGGMTATTVTFNSPGGAVAIPPSRTLVLVADADRRGPFELFIDARDANGITIARGSGSGTLEPGRLTGARVVLEPWPPARPDLARPPDLALPDLATDVRTPDEPDLTPPSCGDGVRNGGETDVDCGGPGSCARCPPGKRCEALSDCGAPATCLMNSCRRPAGEVCVVDGECASGHCAAGRCCDLPRAMCAGCLHCPAGTCLPVAAGQDPSNVCNADVATCQSAHCNGLGSCAVAAGTPCGAPTCMGADRTVKQCDAMGACKPAASPCPTRLACKDAMDCWSDCGADAHCSPSAYCGIETRRCLPLELGLGAVSAAGTSPVALAAGQIAGDARVDLVVANALSNNFTVLVSLGAGKFMASNFTHNAVDRPAGLALDDLDKDGRLDCAVTSAGNAQARVFKGGLVATFNSISNQSTGAAPAALVTGDFTGDGVKDLLVASSGEPSVSLLAGSPANGYSLGAKSDTALAARPVALAAADLDGSGSLDFVAATGAGMRNIVLGRNNGGVFSTATAFTVGKYAVALALADFNKDGRPDLAVADRDDAKLHVLLGVGGGNYALSASYPVGARPVAVAVGDFNRDGTPDLAVAAQDAHAVTLLHGKGGGTFIESHTYPTARPAPTALVVADLDGNGGDDVAFAHPADNSISLLLNLLP